MGFNPRLSPYSIQKEVNYGPNTGTDTFQRDHFLFEFPFAGEMLAAYAVLGPGAAVQAGDDKTTNLWEVSVWKNSADNTTATYATGDRAAKRTGEAANTTGALAWAANTVYQLTNAASSLRRFSAGDKLYLRTAFTQATNHPFVNGSTLHAQVDYIIGYEDGAVPTIASEPS